MTESLAQTTIRKTAGGKALLFIDGDTLRPAAGGKRLLFIDGDDIRPEPGGQRLLFLDGSDVRPAPGGIRLAFWDGPTLRRSPGGPILLVVDGHEIRVKAGDKILYYLDGPAPTRAQLSASLFQLQPELFKPSAEEANAASAAIKEGEAWTLAQTKPEVENGSYTKLGASGPLESVAGFDMKWITNHYAIKFQKSDLVGAAFKMEDSGLHIVGGFGKADCQFGIFAFKEGRYAGAWFSKENGQQQITDSWQIDSNAEGKFASKIGALTLTDAGEKLAFHNKLRLVTSADGKQGVAYQCGNPALGEYLVIVLGSDAMVVDFESRGGSFTGDYFGGKEAKGFFNLTN